jgi:hypothetical protein
MINNTTATLECAAHVNAAASTMSIKGSVVTAPSSIRKHVLVRSDHRQKVLKRDQHQTEPDPDPAEVARAGNPAAPKHEHADQDEQKRNPGHIERQYLDDQGGADIGAQHHGKGRHQVDKPAGRECRNHQTCGRAALEDRCHAETGQEGSEPVAERVAQHPPELRAEGARNPGLDHVHAPNQERNCPAEIHQRQSCVHRARSVSNAVRLPLYTLSPGQSAHRDTRQK